MSKQKSQRKSRVNGRADIVVYEVSNKSFELKNDLKLIANYEGFPTLSAFIIKTMAGVRNSHPELDKLRRDQIEDNAANNIASL